VEVFSTSQYTERTGGPLPACWTGRPLPHRPASPRTHRDSALMAQRLPPATGRLQHHQMPAPNLPSRCRQTELDAKGVTPELLRLKFYCSWTGDFFFLFYKCLSCSLSDCPPSLPVNFFGSPFFFSFFFFFVFLLLSWFC
jgi:hypothetical protein